MKFVDAHIHLSDEEYAGHVSDVLTDAKNSGVVALVSNSMDLKTCLGTLELAERHRDIVYAALGIHPWTVKGLKEEELDQVLQLISTQRGNRAFVALGEIGLDSKYTEIWDKQVKVFDLMLRSAEKLDLPVVIHSRDTTAQVIEVLPSYRLRKVLLHWFSGPVGTLAKVVERGYCITEGPAVAYSDGVREVVRNVPLTSLLTETDGPVRFFKGKTTTPAFIPSVIGAIAEIKGVSDEDVAEQVLRNFQEFFDVKLTAEK